MEHDDINVLVLGGRVIGPALARDVVTAYLAATFTGEERHRRRLQKVAAIEGRYSAYLQQTGKRHEPHATPRRPYQAILFDMDGVITRHCQHPRSLLEDVLDEYLQKWAKKKSQPLRPFEVATDYKIYVEGKPRYLGVLDFLKSRGIALREGTPRDPQMLKPSAVSATGKTISQRTARYWSRGVSRLGRLPPSCPTCWRQNCTGDLQRELRKDVLRLGFFSLFGVWSKRWKARQLRTSAKT
jgi:hypothetical protein